MAKQDQPNESKIRKIIFNEVSLAIAFVSLISGCIFWVTNPQNEMQLEMVRLQSQVESNQTVVQALEKIKNNDFVEIHKSIDQIESRQIEILQAIAAMNERLKDLK